MQRTWLVAGLCLLAAVAGTAVVTPALAHSDAANEDDFPRAEAGLDQRVERNASVLLDASQSFSPSGELVAYRWHVTGPDGGSIGVDCDSSDCQQAGFEATDLGQYEVMLAVEDDAGRSETDVLYVRTVPRGDFGVTLTGPNASDQQGNLTATVAPGDARVENVTWYQGERELANRTIPSYGGEFNHSTYLVPGTQYRAVVTNEWGETAVDTWTAPGGGTWTPSYPGTTEYPRIEGPALVTGDPDTTNLYGNEDWFYDETTYVIRTSSSGSVANGIWTLFGNGTPKTYNADGTTLDPPLLPGPNRVVADLEIERRIQDMRHLEADNGTELRDVINETSEETTIRRQVLVDPAPQIDGFSATAESDSITAEYDLEDPYDPIQQIQIRVGTTVVFEQQSVGTTASIRRSVDVPDGEYGATPVTLRVADGRGQVKTATDSVTLQSLTPDDVNGQPIGDFPSDEINHGGTSPIGY